MSWARLDDRFPEHPKVARLTDKQFRLHVSAICYCARNDTDGVVIHSMVPALRGTKRDALVLVEVGVWELHPDGYYVHDYLKYNRSKADIEAERERKAEAGRLGAANRWNKPDDMAGAIALVKPPPIGSSDAPVPIPSPQPYQAVEEEDSSSSSGEREIFSTALGKLPTKFQYDARTIDEMQLFAKDYAGCHTELADAIAMCRRNNELCFPGNLRKYMPRLDGEPAKQDKAGAAILEAHKRWKEANG